MFAFSRHWGIHGRWHPFQGSPLGKDSLAFPEFLKQKHISRSWTHLEQCSETNSSPAEITSSLCTSCIVDSGIMSNGRLNIVKRHEMLETHKFKFLRTFKTLYSIARRRIWSSKISSATLSASSWWKHLSIDWESNLIYFQIWLDQTSGKNLECKMGRSWGRTFARIDRAYVSESTSSKMLLPSPFGKDSHFESVSWPGYSHQALGRVLAASLALEFISHQQGPARTTRSNCRPREFWSWTLQKLVWVFYSPKGRERELRTIAGDLEKLQVSREVSNKCFALRIHELFLVS